MVQARVLTSHIAMPSMADLSLIPSHHPQQILVAPASSHAVICVAEYRASSKRKSVSLTRSVRA